MSLAGTQVLDIFRASCVTGICDFAFSKALFSANMDLSLIIAFRCREGQWRKINMDLMSL
jgi:hypothetical protein